MIRVPELTRRCLNEADWRPAVELVGRLTPREWEVFVHLSTGVSNQELADALHVTERTVRAHLTQILTKLGIDSRLKACLASYEYGRNIVANDNGLRDPADRMLLEPESPRPVRAAAGRP